MGREGPRAARPRAAPITPPGARYPLWQLRPWPNDPDARLLVFVDHLSVPTAADLAEAIARARAGGAKVVRTSALFPRAATVATASGFVPIDTLALLRLRLDDALDRRLESRFGPHRPHTRAMRAWHGRRAAEIDQQAFGPMWGNDARSIADIRAATPIERARIVRSGRSMAGFAISGTAGDSGYVQRLSVAPAHRRRGIARDLVVDSLWWMRRRGSTTAYVNTGVDNQPALALYEGLGFARLDDQLIIAEHRLGA